MLSAADERDEVQALFSLYTGFQLARLSRDQAALVRAAEDLIQTLSDRYASPAPDAGTRFVITGMLGLAHSERAAHTGDQADLRAAARYLREAVETDPATVPPLFAPFFPTTRAQLMTGLAMVDPRREVIDRAIAEVHRVIEESRTVPWEEARLRLALGRAMIRATTHRSDVSLLDPCIAELSRVRALAAEGHGMSLTVEVLTELSTAHWMSVVTGGPRASEDRKASLDTRREALELMAADVLLQLGAEHALAVARAATGHVLWLALRCAGTAARRAVEALELGRAWCSRRQRPHVAYPGCWRTGVTPTWPNCGGRRPRSIHCSGIRAKGIGLRGTRARGSRLRRIRSRRGERPWWRPRPRR
ncbi:hypothetical protein O1M54_49805 [Streptomyces diastatochromogenes]|nr:hypothetical protein [Streptomyces diastatochromogenes]